MVTPGGIKMVHANNIDGPAFSHMGQAWRVNSKTSTKKHKRLDKFNGEINELNEQVRRVIKSTDRKVAASRKKHQNAVETAKREKKRAETAEQTVASLKAEMANLRRQLKMGKPASSGQVPTEGQNIAKISKMEVELELKKSCAGEKTERKDEINEFYQQFKAAVLDKKDETKLTKLTYGDAAIWHNGLVGYIGRPEPNILEAMAGEHLAGETFVGWAVVSMGKFQEKTISPKTEWEYVASGLTQHLRPNEPPAAKESSFDKSLDFFMQIPRVKAAALNKFEVIAVRLYTGPMYTKYNGVLRERHRRSSTDSNPSSSYVTTLHALSSGIIKLAKTEKPCTVFRGLAKCTLPKRFWEKDKTSNVRGGVEYGCLSTSRSREVAEKYAKKTGEGMPYVILCIPMGMIDRGADITYLSQNSHEEEILFPPLTGLEIAEFGVPPKRIGELGMEVASRPWFFVARL
jgi:ribosomal protein L29